MLGQTGTQRSPPHRCVLMNCAGSHDHVKQLPWRKGARHKDRLWLADLAAPTQQKAKVEAHPWGRPAAQRLCIEKGYWGEGSSQNHFSRRERASGRRVSECLRQARPTQCCCKPCANSICPLRSVQPQPASVVSSDEPVASNQYQCQAAS